MKPDVICDHADAVGCPKPGCPHHQRHEQRAECDSPFALCKNHATGGYMAVQCVPTNDPRDGGESVPQPKESQS